MSIQTDNFDLESSEQRLARLRRLAGLAADDAPREWRWDESDRPQLWRHQLAAPIVTELAELDTVAAMRIAKLLESHPAPRPTSFADLFAHPSADEALLEAIARTLAGPDKRPTNAVLPDVRRALSAVTRLLARIQAQQAIVEPKVENELRFEASWLLDQSWIDDASRRIALSALAMLSA